MKLHWGHGIVIATLLFMGFISTLVYTSMQEKVELVTAQYYEKELRYQEQIAREVNALSLNENISVSIETKHSLLVINYPAEIAEKKISGTISFYRPDNSALDFNIPVKCNEEHRQYIEVNSLKIGLWKIKILWDGDGRPFYYEDKIFI